MAEAYELSLLYRRDIFVGGCFQPHAIHKYDPNLDIMKRILDNAQENGFVVESYTDAFGRLL